MMKLKTKIVVKILLGIAAFVIVFLIVTILFVDPWIARKLDSALNTKYSKYQVTISKVHVPVFTLGLELGDITIHTKPERKAEGDINGAIVSIRIEGIDLRKAIFKNSIDISEMTISGVNGTILFSGDSVQPLISSQDLHIDKLILDGINLTVKSISSPVVYSSKQGAVNVYDLQVIKLDTLSMAIVKQFDFKIEELQSVSGDSMYTLAAGDINYSTALKNLTINKISVHPRYKDYDFTSRHKFQTDCIEAVFNNISVHDFSAVGYLTSGSLVSSCVEMGNMEMDIFRDRRRQFHHVVKPMFQEMIYNYPGKVNIDSILLKTGSVTYTEHAEQANHPGRISFKEINAEIYRISNDTVFKNQKVNLEIKSKALLMGKGHLSILLRSELYDSQNTFTLNGTLSEMEAKDLNPMLERNAFLYAASGKIEKMSFSFAANKNKAKGRMTMRYHGLDIAVKNKETDDTTAIKEIVVSIIANFKVMNSNPLPGKEVRVGIIENKRDPEKFIFNYCFKSILSGIKSSIAKSPTGK